MLDYIYVDVYEGIVLCNDKLNYVYYSRSYIIWSIKVIWIIFGFKIFFDSNNCLNVLVDVKINLLLIESILNLIYKS